MGKDKGNAGEPSTEAESVKAAIDSGEVSWRLLRLLAHWRKLDATTHREKRALGERYYLPTVEAFKAKEKVAEVAVFPPVGGVYIKEDGEMRVTVEGGQISFDWSSASLLIFEVDGLAEEVKEWWRDETPPDTSQADKTSPPSPPDPGQTDKPASPSPPDPSKKDKPVPPSPPDPSQAGTPSPPSRLRRVIERLPGVPRPDRAAAERKPHSMRLYGLATRVVRAIEQENARHKSSEQPPPKPNAPFDASLANFRIELADAQRRFREAAQRAAQSRYWRGMLAGACLLALFCLVLGGVFWWRGVDAAYGVALPAGGVGAIVSVLQRMSSNKLTLDFAAGRDLLEVFGAVRPFIGAIFGIAVMALLLGGIVPAIEIPKGQELAFFAGVGFLAGFNERWAQDMLKGSSTQLSGMGAGEEGAGTASAKKQ